MNVTRILRTVALAIALVVPGFAATTASATELNAPSVGHHYGHYHVFYRECSHTPWAEAGSFDCSHEAYKLARQLRYQGYETSVSFHAE